MPGVTPFLWFDGRLAGAVAFYSSVFDDFALESSSPGADDDLMSATFVVQGQRLMAFNGGPHFRFTPAISLFVSCADQAEVDFYWTALSAGGEEGRCGWLTDQFGLSWQVIPDALGRLLGAPDRERASRVTAAMMAMSKIDVGALEAAYGSD